MIFSIIIPSYNRANTILRALNSILNQSLIGSFEIILVDDGSTDQSQEIVSAWKMKLSNEFQEIFLYECIPHSGVSVARNRGVQLANGDWILFLDSDDEWLPSKLKKQLDFINKNPNLRIHQTEEIWIRNGKRVNPHKKHKKHSGNIFTSSLEQCMVTASSVAIRKDLWQEVGGFDPVLLACEDYDLWLRISSQEEIGLLTEELLIRYGGAPDQLSSKYPVMDRFRIYSILKNWMIFTDEQKYSASIVVLIKLKILENGFLKRGKDSKSLKEIILNVETDQQPGNKLLVDENILKFLIDPRNWNEA